MSIWKTPDQKPTSGKCVCIYDGFEYYVDKANPDCWDGMLVEKWCDFHDLIAQADRAEHLQKQLDTGDLSDGYHTFNELYYHRMCLFSIIVKQHKDLAWKSKLHSDGTMFDNYFIVGIETPNGQATYHYHIDHWDMFDCVELPNAPEYDGYTPDDCLERLLTLKTKETTNNKKKGE